MRQDSARSKRAKKRGDNTVDTEWRPEREWTIGMDVELSVSEKLQMSLKEND